MHVMDKNGALRKIFATFFLMMSEEIHLLAMHLTNDILTCLA